MSEKRKRPETVEEWERLVMEFIGSLTLADHMGDAAEDTQYLLAILGHEPEWDDWPDLMKWLASRGVTTLYGTSLASEDDA